MVTRIDLNKRANRIVEANAMLATFAPAIKIYDDFNSWKACALRMCWDHRKVEVMHDFPADLRGDGSWPRHGYRQSPTGGTGLQALAQLIRYVRDLPRLPIKTWEYWSSDKVRLGNTETMRLLRESEYGDPVRTCCIFCGTTEWENGIDWYHVGRKAGPGCAWDQCRKVGDS